MPMSGADLDGFVSEGASLYGNDLAGASSFRWVISPDESWGKNIDPWLTDIRIAAAHIMQMMVPEVISWMQNNAPWKDRTGAARRGLSAEALDLGYTVTLSVFHTVDYGFWLEISHEGRYAILGRATDYWSVRFWLRFSAAMG